MIEAYVCNLGKYNEGVLAGEPLRLPATAENISSLLSRIGVDGKRYEEIIITNYETPVKGLSSLLGEYEGIDELNYLAALLKELDEDGQLDKFEAALALGEHTDSVRDLINLTQNLGCYDLYPEVENEEDWGYYLINETGLTIPAEIKGYFNYKAYGRDCAMNETGEFTSRGFILNNGNGFSQFYSEPEDIPEKYRIFTYPAEKGATRSILKTLKQLNEAQPATLRDGGKASFSRNER